MGVKVPVGKQHRLLIPEMYKIPGRVMPPQLDFSGGFKRCVLIINMIGSLKLAQTVGVVEPSRFRHQMKGKSVRVDQKPEGTQQNGYGETEQNSRAAS